jgi:hypothetical protein
VLGLGKGQAMVMPDAAVGGIFAIAGTIVGVMGTVILQFLQSKREKEKKRAEKLEELVAAVYEHEHWLNVARDIRVFGEKQNLPLSPATKLQAISTVYFPELEQDIERLLSEARKLEVLMLNAAQKRLENDPSFAEGGVEDYRPYLIQAAQLLKHLREKAAREFR